MTVEQCAKCSRMLNLASFPVRSDTGRRRSECRDCSNARARRRKDEPGWRGKRNATVRRYRRTPHGKTNEVGRNRRAKLRFNHGLELAEYDSIVAKQGGVCAICGQPPDGGRGLVVDHDHVTGQRRGLLCNGCNIGLGKFGDDPDRLATVADYLQR